MFKDVEAIKKVLVISDDEAAIKQMITRSDNMFNGVIDDAESLYNAFAMVQIL